MVTFLEVTHEYESLQEVVLCEAEKNALCSDYVRLSLTRCQRLNYVFSFYEFSLEINKKLSAKHEFREDWYSESHNLLRA
jgi:hypothetical protein